MADPKAKPTGDIVLSGTVIVGRGTDRQELQIGDPIRVGMFDAAESAKLRERNVIGSPDMLKPPAADEVNRLRADLSAMARRAVDAETERDSLKAAGANANAAELQRQLDDMTARATNAETELTALKAAAKPAA